MGNNEPIFSTLGCRLNYYETEAMRKIIDGANLKDTVIINNCEVT